MPDDKPLYRDDILYGSHVLVVPNVLRPVENLPERTVSMCGSCGAPNDSWHCNRCDAEICEECCGPIFGGSICDYCGANPSTDDLPDDEDY